MCSAANIRESGKGNNNCCVVNCTNTYKNTNNLHLYSFPNRKWEVERKMQWIQAVRRTNKDGTPWKPTARSRICNHHFVGGHKSNDPRHPAYMPTIFPELYRKKKAPYGKMLERYNRIHCKNRTVTPEHSVEVEECLEPERIFSDAVTQTSTVALGYIISTTIFCERDSALSIGTLCETEYKNLPVDCATMTDTYDVVATKSISCGSTIELEPQLSFTGLDILNLNTISSDVEMKQLFGVTKDTFNLLCSCLKERLENIEKKGTNSLKLSLEYRLLLLLMKLRLGLPLSILARFFCIHETTAGRIFKEILELLVEITRDWIYWPSRHALKACLPPSFADYPDCRAIIDCTEIRCETPPSVEQCVLMYSQYKGAHTVKILIATTPNGYISFVSPTYGGKATDAYIVQDSGFLELLEPGDQILADKGFPQIGPDVLNLDCILIMPPFLKGSQFSESEVQETYKIAKVRIHVERVIQRLKSYRILDKIPIDLMPYLDSVVRVCCILTNFQAPIIRSISSTSSI